jgi:GNAT superfamily N-acetyltransferase
MSNFKLLLCSDNITREQMHEIRESVLFTDGKYDKNHPDDHNPENFCFVFMDDHTAVGTVRLDFLSDKIAAIRLVAILPKYQRKKVGSKMIAAIEEYAKQHGAQKLVTNAAVDAERFYKSIGYINEEWIDPSEGIARPTTPMSKILVK